jgi:CubicO group peptidase (beta-lactamase class C family)
MINSRRTLALLLQLVILAASSVVCARDAVQGIDLQRLAKADAVMQSYIDDGRLAGISTLVSRNGKVLRSSQYGWRDKERDIPMTRDTIFRIYSMSKPIAAVAALILIEEGRLRLTDPVAKYLPEFAEPVVWNAQGNVPAKNTMTVHQLFTHTAGLSYGFTQHPVDQLYREADLAHSKDPTQVIVSELATLPLVFDPGTAWNYSVATDVLGRIVEIVSGQSLADFFAERIFSPLRMRDTAFFVGDAKQARLARLYGPSEKSPLAPIPDESAIGGSFREKPNFLSGGGGLVSTIDDYWRFAQMLLNKGELDGTRILGRKTVEFMARNHLPAGVWLPSSPAGAVGFGLGVSVNINSPLTGQLSSDGSYGWGGAASTFFWIDPEENLIGISMAQFIPINTHLYHEDFRTSVYQSLID